MDHETILLCSVIGAVALIVIFLNVRNRAVKYAAGVLVLLGLFLVASPFCAPSNGKGSHICAKLWKHKLAACHSLDDVRKRFTCARWEATGSGSYLFTVDPNTRRDGHTWALLYEFPNGDWLAMAYRSSHNTWGGGTVVTRDDAGHIRVFFGHVCGRPQAFSESLEEVYACLVNPPFPLKEVSQAE